MYPEEFREKETLRPLWKRLERFSGDSAVRNGVITFKACSTAGSTCGNADTVEKKEVDAALWVGLRQVSFGTH